MHRAGVPGDTGAQALPTAVLLQIIDNGPGIPAELKDHIFYPLVTGRAEAPAWG